MPRPRKSAPIVERADLPDARYRQRIRSDFEAREAVTGAPACGRWLDC
jgi:hypothetical protein